MDRKPAALLSLVVPCYNEQESLPLFYQETIKIADKLKTQFNLDVEFVFVNDGSKDKTLEELRKLHSQDARVRYVSFSRNFGKESALYAGLGAARGEYVATLDADLQDPPSLIPEMVQFLHDHSDYDCVATRRSTRKGEPLIRSFFAQMFYRLINKMSDMEIVDGARDFRFMTRKFVDAVLAMGEYNRFSKGIFSWI